MPKACLGVRRLDAAFIGRESAVKPAHSKSAWHGRTLEDMLKLRPTMRVVEKREEEPGAPPTQVPSGEYWADFIQAKAELEATLEDLQKQLIASKTDVVEMKKESKKNFL